MLVDSRNLHQKVAIAFGWQMVSFFTTTSILTSVCGFVCIKIGHFIHFPVPSRSATILSIGANLIFPNDDFLGRAFELCGLDVRLRRGVFLFHVVLRRCCIRSHDDFLVGDAFMKYLHSSVPRGLENLSRLASKVCLLPLRTILADASMKRWNCPSFGG